MTQAELLEKAEQAFSNQKDARAVLFSAAENVNKAVLDLETAKFVAISNGTIDGKNAEIREGQLKSFLNHQYAKVETAQQIERGARYAMDQANMEVDHVKTIIRILELPNA